MLKRVQIDVEDEMAAAFTGGVHETRLVEIVNSDGGSIILFRRGSGQTHAPHSARPPPVKEGSKSR